MYIRVYNYNTMDKLKHFEAHTDYIRSEPRAHRAHHSRPSRLRSHTPAASLHDKQCCPDCCCCRLLFSGCLLHMYLAVA